MGLYIGKRTENQQSDGVSIPLSLVSWVRNNGYADEDALEWLREAVYYSAPITHPEGNRRYGDLLLTVKDNHLHDLSVFEPDCRECNDTKVFTAYENCPSCPGDCDVEMCSQSVVREWPCPNCSSGNSDKRRKKRKPNQKPRRYSNGKAKRQGYNA